MTPTPAQVLEDLQAAAWAQGRAAALDNPEAANPFTYLPDGQHRERVDMVPGLPRCGVCGSVPRPQEIVPGWIMARHRAGWGLSKIADRLNDAGIRPLGGGVRWYPSSVKYVLNSHVARGGD